MELCKFRMSNVDKGMLWHCLRHIFFPTLIQLPTAFPPPCLALAQKSVQKSSENHAKSVRIEARGTSRGGCGAPLGFPLAQRAKNIRNVSSWTTLRGPSETPNLTKLGRRHQNASQNCVQNMMSESRSKKRLTFVNKSDALLDIGCAQNTVNNGWI